MRIAFAACLIAFMLAATCVRAEEPESLEADVSTRSVSITSTYSGTEILIFGTVDNSRQSSAEAGTYEIVAIVEGQPIPLAVRHKARVGGLWINTRSIRFSSVPSFYGIATTRPLDEIADPDVLATYQIGFDYVRMVPWGSARWAPTTKEEEEEYRTAVIRLKKRDSLFVQSEHGVIFRGQSLFRATIALPPNVPVGPLTTRLFLFKDGKMLSQYKGEVILERTGLERFLYHTADTSAFLYGLATVLVAGAFGVLASFLFRRTSGG